MKRTAFRPKMPPARPCKQYEGVNPSKPRETVVSIIETRSVLVYPIEKAKPVRSASYRRFVASHSCFDCGISGWSQCAHENVDKGMAMKACDLRTFPLCAPRFGLLGCHQEFDLGLGLDRDERREQGRQWVERMQALARAAGRKEFA